jgi:NADPH-dependent 2,4-dienoyl-CoA reductase/sulfur reductase-like enzyme
VVAVDPETKKLTLNQNEDIFYEKLIFATGSEPIVPPIPGHNFDGVVTIRKDLAYIKSIYESLKAAQKVVIVGAGFIGVEMSDELAKAGVNVTLVEAMDTILPLAFDADIILPAQDLLKSHGVVVKTSEMVDSIQGENGKVTAVKLKSGELIEADHVVLAIGYRPNTVLAKETGLRLGQFGGIMTDEYMRSSCADIFAVGDCAKHRDFFTHKPSRLMLASTAAAEARIAGMNLFHLKVMRQTKGSIAIFSTSLGKISLGAAGLTEKAAKAEGFEIIVGTSAGMDRHPGKLPGTLKQHVKLIFAQPSGLLIGAQIQGGQSTGEMINILGLAIQKNMTAAELAVFQYGTQPMLTAGPGVYPICTAAMDALAKMNI